MHSDDVLEMFKRWGKEPPAHYSHEINDTKENPISEQIPKTVPANWRLEGNKLIFETPFGEVINFIPTGYICTGTDENNLPILKKIV